MASSEKLESAINTPAEAVEREGTTMREHWRCLAACTLVSLCPFQFGVDFGVIGGLQAMVGFLEVGPPLATAPG